MNSENAAWLRLLCKTVLALQFVGLAVGCWWFIRAVNKGFDPSPEVVATACVWIASQFAFTGVFVFIGFCIADFHSHFRRQGNVSSAPQRRASSPQASPTGWLQDEK
jgi:hypothetical protein